MQTIFVSPEFPLNRRMRRAVRRGKLRVVREGGERLSLGGGMAVEARRAVRTFSSPLVCMASGGSGIGGGNGWNHCGNPKHPPDCRLLWKYPTECKFCKESGRGSVPVIAFGCCRSAVYFNPWDKGGGAHLHDNGGEHGDGDAYWKMLTRAASEGDIETVNYLVQMPNIFSRIVNKADKHGRTSLLIAAMGNHPELIKTLVEHGGNAGHRDEQQNAIMQYGVVVDAPGSIRVFAELQMDMNVRDKAGSTLLHLAIREAFRGGIDRVRDRAGVISALIDCGANPNAASICGADGDSAPKGCKGRRCAPVVFAAMRNRWELVDALVRGNACPEAKDCRDLTPMHWAAWHDDPNAVVMLAKAGANVNSLDEAGQTPLDLAEAKNQHRAANKLTEYGGKRKEEL